MVRTPNRGYSQLHELGNGSRLVAQSPPSRAYRGLSPQRALVPSHPRISPGPSSSLVSVNGANVHNMLSDLVELSQSIAAILEQEPSAASLGGGNTAVDSRQQATLKAQEIERIVKRVEAHFISKLSAAESANRELESQVRRLSEQVESLQAQLSSAAGGEPRRAGVDFAPMVRGGLKEQGQALEDLSKSWATGGPAEHDSDVEQLRRVLLAEKRQRLLVEEQTQSLTEQHAKVVATLERRLHKQEDQLRDLINAMERHTGGATSAVTTVSLSPSPGRPSTPRHILRQQLAQHQQTQRALQQYRAHLGQDSAVPDPEAASEGEGDGEEDYLDTLGLGELRTTVELLTEHGGKTSGEDRAAPPTEPERVAAKSSTNPAEIVVSQPASQPTRPSTAAPPVVAPPPPAASVVPSAAASGAAEATSEVDDITAFLDNITKELESIGAD